MTHPPQLPLAKGLDAVRFYVAPNLPYSRRLLLATGLFLVGCTVQVTTLEALGGLPFIVAALLLVAVKGYDSRIRLKGFDIDPAWKMVSIEKIRELEALRRRAREWDRDAFDASNPLGCATFVLCNGVVGIVAGIVGAAAGDWRAALIVVLDGLAVVWLFWFTGMRFILKESNLTVKVRVVLAMHEAFEKVRREGETFVPALMFARKGSGAVPIDVRFTVGFPGSPEGFFGLQAQIALNLVQGRSYPYFYCVLAAARGFGIAKYRPRLALPPRVVCEYQESPGAEVLVIRQKTTKNSGYHTDAKACQAILKTALEGGRAIAG